MSRYGKSIISIGVVAGALTLRYKDQITKSLVEHPSYLWDGMALAYVIFIGGMVYEIKKFRDRNKKGEYEIQFGLSRKP